MTGGVPPVIALFGPTAAGKTEFAIALAEALAVQGTACTAISADAYQLYRGLELLSGAPTPAERDRLEHRLVASHGIGEEMSAGRFAGEAHAAIDSVLERGAQPLVIGGSGLYMQAALTELPMRPPLDDAMQARAAEVAGAEPQERERLLAQLTPQAAPSIDATDAYRAGRAVALAEAGEQGIPGEDLWSAPLRRPTLIFGLTRDRDELYARIDARIDRMVALGAADEVARAAAGASTTARKAIGFEELPAGRVDEMKTRTRRYAKRQLTWMRRMALAGTFNLTQIDVGEAVETVLRAARPTAE